MPLREEGPQPLVPALGGAPIDDYIEAQEARGQAKLVDKQGTVLPAEVLHSTDEDLEALGFEFGETLEDDPLFRNAKLPEGCTIVGTDHNMWSKVVDAEGSEVAAIFYKAAFYDRRAHIQLGG